MLARPPSAASQCLFSVAARQPPPDPGTRTRKERKSRSPMWLPAERRCCGGCSALLGAALLVVLLSHQPSAPTRVLVEGGQTSVLPLYPTNTIPPRTPQREFNRFQSSALIAPTFPLRRSMSFRSKSLLEVVCHSSPRHPDLLG